MECAGRQSHVQHEVGLREVGGVRRRAGGAAPGGRGGCALATAIFWSACELTYVTLAVLAAVRGRPLCGQEIFWLALSVAFTIQSGIAVVSHRRERAAGRLNLNGTRLRPVANAVAATGPTWSLRTWTADRTAFGLWMGSTDDSLGVDAKQDCVWRVTWTPTPRIQTSLFGGREVL